MHDIPHQFVHFFGYDVSTFAANGDFEGLAIEMGNIAVTSRYMYFFNLIATVLAILPFKIQKSDAE